MTDTVNVPRKNLEEVRDVLTERIQGSPARSPAHNARVLIDTILAAAPKAEPVSDPYKLEAIDPQIIKRLQSKANAPGIGDSVMVFGPDLRALLRAYSAAQPLSNPQQLPEAQKGDPVAWVPEWKRKGTDTDGDPIQIETSWGDFTGRAVLSRGEGTWGAHINRGGGTIFALGTSEEEVRTWLESGIRHRVAKELERARVAFELYTHPAPFREMLSFPYHRTFHAIADAVTWQPNKSFGISVEAFERSFNAKQKGPQS